MSRNRFRRHGRDVAFNPNTGSEIKQSDLKTEVPSAVPGWAMMERRAAEQFAVGEAPGEYASGFDAAPEQPLTRPSRISTRRTAGLAADEFYTTPIHPEPASAMETQVEARQEETPAFEEPASATAAASASAQPTAPAKKGSGG